MSLESYCSNPACKRRYVFPSGSAGRSVRCNACGQTFIAGNSVTVDAPASVPWSAPEPTAAPLSLDPEPLISGPANVSVTLASTLDTSLGRFIVRDRLGAGAFGTVYRAYDPHLDREVALKVPNPGSMDTPKRVERFLREAKAAARLRHPYIVPVFDAGQDGNRYYIASAFIDGKPLSDAIPETGMAFDRAAKLVRELAEALAYAHEQGIVHRDVKPQNVMLDKHDRVHLMDFGLAARHDEEAKLTADGAVMGTPAYMSPEQAKGQKGDAQPATDQYAVGVVLYELLTGVVPFSGPPAVVIANVIATEPDPPHKHRVDVPKDLETICLKAMAKKPEDRYPNCQELADDLRRWLEEEPITARPLAFGERATRWVRKEPKLAAAAAAVALVLLVSVVLISSAARRADGARQQAEKDAADVREADKRTEKALAEARAAREGEARAVAALALAVLERKKSEAWQVKFEEERKKTAELQGKFDEERKKVEALEAKLKAPDPKVPDPKAPDPKELGAKGDPGEIPLPVAKFDAAKLIGKWELKNPKKGLTYVREFAAGGKSSLTFGTSSEPVKFDYKVDGDKLSLQVAVEGKMMEYNFTLTKLTDDELELKDKTGTVVGFKRVKP